MVLTLIMSQPGFCGRWQVRYEADGENYSNTNGTQPWTNTMTYFVQNATGTRQASSSGAVTPVLEWVPEFEGDLQLPPTKAYTMVYATAKAGGYAYSAATGQIITPTMTVNNGLDSTIITDRPATSSQPALKECYDYRLIIADNAGRATTVRFAAKNLEATASVSGASLSSAQVTSYISYTVVPIDARAIEPDPKGLPALGQNEYVMVGGGNPFVVPCRIQLRTTDSIAPELFRLNADWLMTRPLPGQLSKIENGASSNPLHLFPQFRSDVPPAPGIVMSGLGYSTMNGLPASNGAFGGRDIEHYLFGSLLDKSPIEIFYNATLYTHQVGAAKWCDISTYSSAHSQTDEWTNNLSPIPNWFHYYSQAYTAPSPITYDPQGSAAFGGSWYQPGSDHIHIGNDAHGSGINRLWEVRDGYGPFVVKVGYQKSYGIDTFARTVTHEHSHKLIHALAGTPNTDGDGLSNSLEESLQLNPNRADTTRFSEAYPTYATYADQDVYCQMQEKDVRGNREADWADDGLNKGTVPGPDDVNRDPKIYYATPQIPPT